MKFADKIKFFALFPMVLGLSSCFEANEDDLVAACNLKTIREINNAKGIYGSKALLLPKMTDAEGPTSCQVLLEESVPFKGFDVSDKAREVKFDVLKAMHALMFFPQIYIPETQASNEVDCDCEKPKSDYHLGVKGQEIPDEFLEFAKPLLGNEALVYSDSFNRAGYEYMKKYFHRAEYGGSKPGSLARFGAYTVTFFDAFKQYSSLQNTIEVVSTLVHELRHHNRVHVDCDRQDGTQLSCDNNLNSPYGASSILRAQMFQGLYFSRFEGEYGYPLITEEDMFYGVYSSCSVWGSSVNNLPPILYDSATGEQKSCYPLTEQWSKKLYELKNPTQEDRSTEVDFRHLLAKKPLEQVPHTCGQPSTEEKTAEDLKAPETLQDGVDQEEHQE